jgi:putative tryptophan/tyrosine transport system substrate-binding protein
MSIWPVGAGAQQRAMPVIGFLGGGSLGPSADAVAAVYQGLGETGYVEGQNLATEHRWAEGRFDRLPDLATDLVGRGVDLILAVGDPATLAARNATPTIPIVFGFAGDPVEHGLIASFGRPGGNMTGVAIMLAELMPKRLELLCELVPRANAIGLLVNPDAPAAVQMIPVMQEAARGKGLLLQILKARTEGEIDAALANLVQGHVEALVVGPDTFFFSQRQRIVTLAASHSIPTSYFAREFAEAGGLISYGPNINVIYRLVGVYAGRILKGEKPADLPVQQPTKFELVINLKTARTLGLTVPPLLLAQADDVIE